MAKTENITSADKPSSRSWMIGVIGWLLPGVGHLLQRRWGRATILGGAVWICFISGLAMGGHLFDLTSSDPNASVLLQIPPMIADIGSGLLYMVCWLFDVGFGDDPVRAAQATYEYGTTFLLIAGLLNYLAMLDAFDIAAGRKS